ncbi:MAG: hypothetical protein IH796_07745 [Deltaproteobacteria bacterium]|nr:hypothetical protein [Deltaproteobacteria bacterium]
MKAAQRFTMLILHSFPALMALLVLPASQALACGASVQVLDTWVEQGNFFHVQFRVAPQDCLSVCEGLIEFRVEYESFSNRETDSVFGMSTWHFDPEEETHTYSHGIAHVPLPFCSRREPCNMHDVGILHVHCSAC